MNEERMIKKFNCICCGSDCARIIKDYNLPGWHLVCPECNTVDYDYIEKHNLKGLDLNHDIALERKASHE